ncbi:MAG: hypothetical protein GX442_24055 [Candidatus Riflebacteria bacterium]|nr:hypothetical protein [Candidatus Riflebacteria bacterium]
MKPGQRLSMLLVLWLVVGGGAACSQDLPPELLVPGAPSRPGTRQIVPTPGATMAGQPGGTTAAGLTAGSAVIQFQRDVERFNSHLRMAKAAPAGSALQFRFFQSAREIAEKWIDIGYEHSDIAGAVASATGFILPRGAEDSLIALEQTIGELNPEIPENSPFGFHPAAVVPPFPYGSDDPYSFAKEIGVKWDRPMVYFFWILVQPNLAVNEFQWDRFDRLIASFPRSMRMMGNIALGSPRAEGGRYTEYAVSPGSYLPKDEAAYQTFVKAVVERYDGDGTGDMPGLGSPIRVWQVDNEPPSGRSDYARFLYLTATAIKEADPNALVMIGGATGQPPTAAYLGGFDRTFLPILEDLAKLGGKPFDIFDLHWYGDATGDYLGVKEVLEHIREKVDALGLTPPAGYWITEMGTYSGNPLPFPGIPGYDPAAQTEKQQAIDLVKRFVYPLSLGVSKVFPAFGLNEGFKGDGGYFEFTGLIYEGQGEGDLGRGVKKLGYYTYRKMVGVLEGSQWQSLRTLRQDGGVHLYKFTNRGRGIWVAWNDLSSEATIEIDQVKGREVVITRAVPACEAGRDVKNPLTACPSERVAVKRGKVSVTLDQVPVYIEEQPVLSRTRAVPEGRSGNGQ